MGSIISHVRLTLLTLRAVSAAWNTLSKRLSESPSIPVQNPSLPYWTIPKSPVARHGANSELPQDADVVIIGSGITGTSIARALLENGSEKLKVVMLEARDACYGATARNGGHCWPILYPDYSKMKKQFGRSMAKKIIRFRLAHLEEFLKVAQEENLLAESQCRKVEAFDVFFDKEFFEISKQRLKAYLDDNPEEADKWEIKQSLEGVSERAVGAIITTAGALHPYRLVTGILSRLVKLENFQLFTHTPCTSIVTGGSHYKVNTPRGTIYTSHIVHATNAWTSHLLEPMRRKIIPARGNMTAQRPGLGLSWTSGSRSFVFYRGGENQWDYLTQQPDSSSGSGSYPPPRGEMIFGGGFIQGGFAESAFFTEVGNADDSKTNFGVECYLSGALSTYFGSAWGEEGRDDDKASEPGRVKKSWSGILGMSADGRPWVGRLSDKVTGRSAPRDASSRLAAPAEWLAAGFTGEGMVHAWMCGKALAHEMIQGSVVEWLPEVFRITEERWRAAQIENMV